MIITRKAISRRAVLRGIGVTVGLPLLDGMIPGLSALENTPVSPPRRLGFVYVPNGANKVSWFPSLSDGGGLKLSPTLSPLAPVQDQVAVFSGLRSFAGDGDHSRAGSAWMTGVAPKRTQGADLLLAKSIDQIAADELGKDTQFRSLQLATDENVWNCDGYACSYMNTLSWRTPTTPLPMQSNPRVVFERLFSDGRTKEVRQARRSILDSIAEEAARFMRTVSTGDRARLTDYLDGVRELERRVEKMEQQAAVAVPEELPPGIPDLWDEYVKLMFDVQVLAYQADLTRVITFMLAKETSQRTFNHIGVPEAHHGLSHHDNKPDMLAQLARIDKYHVELLSYYVQKLASTPDGDGSLLDHTLITYGSGMGDGNNHATKDLPLVLVGGGVRAGGGRHIVCAPDTPLTNLHLSLLDKCGIHLDSFGDSTGRLAEL